MGKAGRWFEFLVVAASVAGALHVLVALLLDGRTARDTTLVTSLHCLWAARLVLGFRRGWITDRFAFLGTAGMNDLLRITGATVLDRREDRWEYWNYILRESALCVVCWLLFVGNIVVPPLLQRAGLPVQGAAGPVQPFPNAASRASMSGPRPGLFVRAHRGPPRLPPVRSPAACPLHPWTPIDSGAPPTLDTQPGSDRARFVAG
ncbi:MAG: hypothetical protein V2J02_02525 [Pseudomonadales bacterium]|nr:hypothetical protein [Pseudomonadales bacterium]